MSGCDHLHALHYRPQHTFLHTLSISLGSECMRAYADENAIYASRSHHGATLPSSTSLLMLVHTGEAIAISAGYQHSLMLKRDGTVWATGWNGNGQLGDGTTTDSDTFEEVFGPCGTVMFKTDMRIVTHLPLAITHTDTCTDWTADSTIYTHASHFAFMLYQQ